MQGKELFTSQIEALKLYTLCDAISFISEHSHLPDSIIIRNNGLSHTITLASFVEENKSLSSAKFQAISSSICFASDDKHVVYLRVKLSSALESTPTDNVVSSLGSEFVKRQSLKAHSEQKYYTLAFYFKNRIPAWLINLKHSASKIRLPEQQQVLLQQLKSMTLLLQLISGNSQLNADPLTKLNARALLHQRVNHLADEHSVVLCLVHCCEFQQINKKQGSQIGDILISQIAEQITVCTRTNDEISRLGGALFAVASAVNGLKEAEMLGNKLQQYLQQQAFLIEHSDNGMPMKLSFHVGVALVDFDEPNNNDIDKATVVMNRAEQALQAAQANDEGTVVTWDIAKFSINEEQFNYLGGIFTADTMTNYRNMLLLWDISSIIADEFEFSKLLHNVVQRLANTFDFHSAGLWRPKVEDTNVNSSLVQDSSSLCYQVNENAQVSMVPSETAFRDPIIEQQIILARDMKQQQEHISTESTYWALPLEINTEDCFYIVGEASRFILTHDTKVLIQGFVRQIGKALRRSQLEEQLNKRLESQNAMLESELNELKGGLSSSALVYKSPVMQTIMKQTQRAAATDTTVLITGESGTGKERLIHAIHTLGPRQKKPLIIVDCGSIPETLIESELFGYVKGAFTGAQKGANGKIKEADGGIIVLDEIGELPLPMQPKLLRFVQEKHYTPVGGTRVVDVDVKIVAVTNRDLALEVERGRFRKDLFYRLNVVTLNNPALRDRGEDLSLLAHHFLNKFSKQFETEKKFLSNDTLKAMSHYSWPGNIRELENKLMQATLLSENQEITLDELNIEFDSKANVAEPKMSSYIEVLPGRRDDITDLTGSQIFSENTELETTAVFENDEDNYQDQATFSSKHDEHSTQIIDINSPRRQSTNYQKVDALLEKLSACALVFLNDIRHEAAFIHLSLGTSVEDELLIQAYQSCNGNMRDLSARMQLPTSTARRRINKILLNLRTQTQEKPTSWIALSECLQPIAEGKILIPDCLDTIKVVLLEAILESQPTNMSKAAALLGVSEPTFYKLKKQRTQQA
ncbi:sigma 54-interacting transcriptional regulator [Glaciecola sp. MH2013]|uniref:sigma 54-interacting transcriptional regulator n=1 Tax=Glaciecola sp. MH2013 TaxID=2785524 RepID=UPI0018A02FFB|nr:sigma 54-interacting transcriptional regulator [Glaciecola sp. MH2013]MBF7073730.1 sigma 54-interacting transcriptional regulator [Glaciecola sp. MH2013]